MKGFAIRLARRLVTLAAARGVSRIVATAPFACLFLIGVMGFAAMAVRSGLMADDAMTLWAQAITAGNGGMPIGLVLAAYPTLPFLASAVVERIAPVGTPAPALLAAGIGAGLAAAWFGALRAAGFSVAAAGAIAALLIFHPGIMRAAVAGPSEILLVVFLALFGVALHDLRARSGVSEVMTAALSLAGLAFSHPMGAAIACAAVPFLIFAVQPRLAANSAVNMLLALVFPALFAGLSFAYVSWVFPAAGWSFLVAPAQGLSTWSAAFMHRLGGFGGWIALDAAIAVALAFALSAPVLVLGLVLVYRRRPLVTPLLVFVAAVVTAAGLATATGLFGDPAALAAAAPVLAAVLLARVPDLRHRLGTVLSLLALGWLGGALALVVIDPRVVTDVGGMAMGADTTDSSYSERADALDLGGATIGRDGVMVDSVNAPAVVVGRGRSVGLVSPHDDDFSLSLITATVRPPFVAVPDPTSRAGALDRVNKAFPQLYRRGPPGYRLVYHNNSWRLFARQ